LSLFDSFRILLAQLKLELEQLAARIEQMDTVIQQLARENEACQRLTEIPGVGPNCDCSDRCGGQRKKFVCLDGDSSARMLHRRQAEATGHQ